METLSKIGILFDGGDTFAAGASAMDAAATAAARVEAAIANLSGGLSRLGEAGAAIPSIAEGLSRLAGGFADVGRQATDAAAAVGRLETAARAAGDASANVVTAAGPATAAAQPATVSAATIRSAAPAPADEAAATADSAAVDRIAVALERAQTRAEAFARSLAAIQGPEAAVAAALQAGAAAFETYQQAAEASGGTGTALAIAQTQLQRALATVRADLVSAAVAAAQAAGAQAQAGQAAGAAAPQEEALARAAAQVATAEREQAQAAQTSATGQASATTATRSLATAFTQTAEAAGRFQTTGAFLFGASSGQRSFVLVNIAEQLRQLFEQLSFGTSPMQAFAQQLPQMTVGLGVFGAGIGLAVGAIGGLVTLLPVLIGRHDEAAKAAKAQTTENEALAKALQVTTTSSAEFGASVAGLTVAQRDLLGAGLAAQLDKDRKALEETTKAADNFVATLGQSAKASSAVIAGFQAGITGGVVPAGTADDLSKVDAAAQDLVKTWQAYVQGILGAANANQGAAPTWAEVAIQIQSVKANAEGHAGATTADTEATQRSRDTLLQYANTLEIGRQAQQLHNAQVQEFLALSQQVPGALTEEVQKILNTAEATQLATGALNKYNLEHRKLVDEQAAQQIQNSGLPGASAAADAFRTEQDQARQRETQRQSEARQIDEITTRTGFGLEEATRMFQSIHNAQLQITGPAVPNYLALLRRELQLSGLSAQQVNDVINTQAESFRHTADAAQHAGEVQALVSRGIDPTRAEAITREVEKQASIGDQRVQLQRQLNDLETAHAAGVNVEGGYETRRHALLQQIAQIDGQRSETLRSQLNSLAGQADAEERLRAAEEKLNATVRQARQQGTPVPQERVDAARQGIAADFARAVEQQAANENRSASQAQVNQAKINALLEAEVQHKELSASLDAEIARLRGEQANIDAHELEQLNQENQQIDSRIAQTEARLAVLKARGQGEVALLLQQAEEAGRAAVKPLTPQQEQLPGAGQLEAERDARRQRLGDLAREQAAQQVANEILGQSRSPLEDYTLRVRRANEALAAHIITQDEHTRAVGADTTAQDQLNDVLAASRARITEFDLLYRQGNITLQRRHDLLLNEIAVQGAASAAQRQANIQRDINIGEPGSGADFNKILTAGLDAASNDIINTYANVSRSIATSLRGAFDASTDALTQFVLTGKLDIQGLAQTIIHDLVQTAIRTALANAIVGVTGLFAFGGAGGGAPAALFPFGLLGGAGGGASAGGAGIGAGLYHAGGYVGAGEAPERNVSPAAFVGAPRFHGGGTVGLLPGEVPIIAQAGERVMTANAANDAGPAIQVTNNYRVDARGAGDPVAVRQAVTVAGEEGRRRTIDSLSRSPRLRQRVAAR